MSTLGSPVEKAPADQPDRTASRSIFSAASQRPAAKVLVGAGLVAGFAAVIIVPVRASDSSVPVQAAPSAALIAERRAADAVASRGGQRDNPNAAAAVTAPASAPKPQASAVKITVSAKPKPTAQPIRERVESASRGAAESGRSSRQSSDAPAGSRSDRAGSNSGSAGSTSGSDSAFFSEGKNKGLGNGAARVYSVVRSQFGVRNVGGFRAGDGDHGEGRAVDVMITGSTADAVAAWAIDNMAAYNLDYVIWRQRIWLAGASGWRSMSDRGSPTQNHMDHVHISVK